MARAFPSSALKQIRLRQVVNILITDKQHVLWWNTVGVQGLSNITFPLKMHCSVQRI